jgi:hypothetical protein
MLLIPEDGVSAHPQEPLCLPIIWRPELEIPSVFLNGCQQDKSLIHPDRLCLWQVAV